MARHSWPETDETNETDGTAGSSSLVQLNLVQPVTWLERSHGNHPSYQYFWGVREQQESHWEWCHGRAMERRVLTEESVRIDVVVGDCNLMALDECVRGESILFVFAHRGDSWIQTRNQKQR